MIDMDKEEQIYVTTEMKKIMDEIGEDEFIKVLKYMKATRNNVIKEDLNKASLDNINPDHYKNSTSLECIEAMELAFGHKAVLNFCICNAWKYLWRWKNKNGTEDLEKAEWYCNKAADLDTHDLNRETIDSMLCYILENSCQESQSQ